MIATELLKFSVHTLLSSTSTWEYGAIRLCCTENCCRSVAAFATHMIGSMDRFPDATVNFFMQCMVSCPTNAIRFACFEHSKTFKVDFAWLWESDRWFKSRCRNESVVAEYLKKCVRFVAKRKRKIYTLPYYTCIIVRNGPGMSYAMRHHNSSGFAVAVPIFLRGSLASQELGRLPLILF